MMRATSLRDQGFAVWSLRVDTSVFKAQNANIASENGFGWLLPLSQVYVAAPSYSRRQHLQSAYGSSLPLMSTDSSRLGCTYKPNPYFGGHKRFVALVWKV